MTYQHAEIAQVAKELKARLESLSEKRHILRDPMLAGLYESIKTLPEQQRGSFGVEVNKLKQELESVIAESLSSQAQVKPIDVTAPFDANIAPDNRPRLLATTLGSIHPLTQELEVIQDILVRMGFNIVESRQLDDDYHMFESLNFPPDHPARDDLDTFITTEGLIAPAQTSTMQNRVLKDFKGNLEAGEPIAVAIAGRVFRNEDLDATHEHTFYQLEGVYVDKGINVGNLIATLRAFLSAYFGEDLRAKIQPFYFPFTEPSFEFAIERPAVLKKGDTEADQWLEILGCGLIHPNVLKMADIDPEVYTGFAWGGGIERLVMMKYVIEDIRHFESGKLAFLRQFS